MTASAEYTEATTDPLETVQGPQTDIADTADTAVTSEEGGVLILGGTPIGNLADASDRLRSALATADLIAVEDTRKLRTLASGLGVRTRGRIIVNHDHNEAERSETIVQAVQDGQRCCCSDAGMPTISDPGYIAVAAVAEANLPVTVVPGPSAALTALALSGLPTDDSPSKVSSPQGLRAHRRLASLVGGGAHHDFLRIPAPHRRDPGRLRADLRRQPPRNGQSS